jgi:hypothetical protein
VQHRTAIERGATVVVRCERGDGGLGVWVEADGAVAVTATVAPR